MKLFIDSDNNIIDSELFISSLKPYINTGDFIYVEMDIMRFGKLYDLEIPKDELLEAFYQIFYKLIGDKGHMSFPSFSYSWGSEKNEKVFDKLNTPGKVGAFPEYIRKKRDSYYWKS